MRFLIWVQNAETAAAWKLHAGQNKKIACQAKQLAKQEKENARLKARADDLAAKGLTLFNQRQAAPGNASIP